jgi:mRNA interferase RelE/StbE
VPTVEDTLNAMLGPVGAEIRFSKKAVEDLTGYKKEQQEKILAMIVARAKKGPLIKPKGIGEPLNGELHGFTKIKPKHLGLRVIYRPIQQTAIIMEIIAIGPRERDKVYTLAAKRLQDFHREMSERSQAGSPRENT